MGYDIDSYADTDIGDKRKAEGKKNEDYRINDCNTRLFIVADGVGGHASGEKASEIAAENIWHEIAYFVEKNGDCEGMIRKDSKDIESMIRDAIKVTNAKIYDDNLKKEGGSPDSRKYMCTTVSLALLTHDRLYIGFVGNSRIYVVDEGRIHKNRLKIDDAAITFKIEEEVANQRFTEEDAVRALLQHPYKNVVGKVVGADKDVDPTVKSYPIGGISHVLLCTDGLTDNATDSEIERIIMENGPKEAVERLISLANNPQQVEIIAQKMLADETLPKDAKERVMNSYKGNDNITVIAIKISHDEKKGVKIGEKR